MGTQNVIVPIPDGMSFTDAAALPVVGNTVLRATMVPYQVDVRQGLADMPVDAANGDFHT